ncbi:hypothetical protein QR680_018101 [Steinernema hermaphroditum]|uniref:F-box domain-containing protein n=1 Tax=Steinernema hermaphroditum TaxID=289476 RepID=A0AA39LQA3_9BILA|nr:hypothetical protein QR680_018101 [Steinernema hermaphroditum]
MERLETKLVESIVDLIPSETLHLLTPLDSKWGRIASKRLNSYICCKAVFVFSGQKCRMMASRCSVLSGEIAPWDKFADLDADEIAQTTVNQIVLSGNLNDPPSIQVCPFAYERNLTDPIFRDRLVNFLGQCRLATNAEIRVDEVHPEIGRILVNGIRSGFQRAVFRKCHFDIGGFLERLLKENTLATVMISHSQAHSYLPLLLKNRPRRLNHAIFEESSIEVRFIRELLSWWNQTEPVPQPLRVRFISSDIYRLQNFFQNNPAAKRYYNQPAEGVIYLIEHVVEMKRGRPNYAMVHVRRSEIEIKLTNIPGL